MRLNDLINEEVEARGGSAGTISEEEGRALLSEPWMEPLMTDLEGRLRAVLEKHGKQSRYFHENFGKIFEPILDALYLTARCYKVDLTRMAFASASFVHLWPLLTELTDADGEASPETS